MRRFLFPHLYTIVLKSKLTCKGTGFSQRLLRGTFSAARQRHEALYSLAVLQQIAAKGFADVVKANHLARGNRYRMPSSQSQVVDKSQRGSVPKPSVQRKAHCCSWD